VLLPLRGGPGCDQLRGAALVARRSVAVPARLPSAAAVAVVGRIAHPPSSGAVEVAPDVPGTARAGLAQRWRALECAPAAEFSRPPPSHVEPQAWRQSPTTAAPWTPRRSPPRGAYRSNASGWDECAMDVAAEALLSERAHCKGGFILCKMYSGTNRWGTCLMVSGTRGKKHPIRVGQVTVTLRP
jgi:hypothetical protein